MESVGYILDAAVTAADAEVANDAPRKSQVAKALRPVHTRDMIELRLTSHLTRNESFPGRIS